MFVSKEGSIFLQRAVMEPRYGRIYKSYSVNENSSRDRLNTEWAPGIIISSGLTRFLPAELCFRSGIYPCTMRARWLIIELESHACTGPSACFWSRATLFLFFQWDPSSLFPPSVTPLCRQKILFLAFFYPTWWFLSLENSSIILSCEIYIYIGIFNSIL